MDITGGRNGQPYQSESAAHSPEQILIIGVNYWPEITGNAPYTTGLAEHLVKRGHNVHVMTGMPYYPAWCVGEGYERRLRFTETRNGVRIHRFRQYIPSRQSAIKRIGFEVSFLLNAMISRATPPPDLILGYLPSLSDGVLAAITSRRFGVPFGLIVQDLVAQSAAQSGILGGGKVAGCTRAIEGWIARHAAGIAVVAEGFRPRLVDLGVAPNQIHRVRNWTHIGPPTRTPSETRSRLGLPSDVKIVMHAGNMGLKQGLENVIEVARMAEQTVSGLLFVFVGDGNQRELHVSSAVGLANVRFLPPQTEEELPNVLAAADLLLVNQRPTVTDMSLPSKLTSYFSAGRPVIAAVSSESETKREMDAARAGIVVPAGDPAALLHAIQQLLADPDSAETFGQNGQRYQEEMLAPAVALLGIEAFIASLYQCHTKGLEGYRDPMNPHRDFNANGCSPDELSWRTREQERTASLPVPEAPT